MGRTNRNRGSWAGMALAVSLAGCGSSSEGGPPSTAAPSRVFVGVVEGTDVRVGIVATTHHARVFFCGGDVSYATLTHWIPSASLDPAGGALSQGHDAAGWSVDGKLDDGGATGTVVAGAAGTFSFHAAPVSAGTIAGLYEGAEPCGKVGLIVTQNGAVDEPAGQGACVPTVVGSMASNEQVNPIRPLARAADGTIPVTVAGAMALVRVAAAPAE
ncbi:MAG TPA: hypothetical protein VH044_12370 [Polyangiaceae bacterium]|nr:hypothetical protein [Polyangiaceae bacterium]